MFLAEKFGILFSYYNYYFNWKILKLEMYVSADNYVYDTYYEYLHQKPAYGLR